LIEFDDFYQEFKDILIGLVDWKIPKKKSQINSKKRDYF
jgi:hypothetical protein